MFLIGAVCDDGVSDDSSHIIPGWRLTFRDEFGGTAPDTSKWSLRDPWMVERNLELQAYVEDAITVNDGVLRITASEDTATYDGKLRNYTSGMMITYPHFSQQFGRFEVRCRVPKGQGLWPAVWMLPDPLDWPPEIDILEILGHQTDIIYLTHHWGESGTAEGMDGGNYHIENGPDFSESFHVIAVEWSPTEIIWYVDGVEHHRSAQHIPTTKMYILCNLAVGGMWPGSPDENTEFPAHFEIDYVRVYEKE